jgi:hypothetical protein
MPEKKNRKVKKKGGTFIVKNLPQLDYAKLSGFTH